jgi:hypothetical protein
MHFCFNLWHNHFKKDFSYEQTADFAFEKVYVQYKLLIFSLCLSVKKDVHIYNEKS